MTTAQIARDAQYLVKTQPIFRRGWPISADAVIARMNRAEHDGTYDRDADGLRRSRQGRVGDAMMTCQVATMAGDPLLIFGGWKTAISGGCW